MKFEVNQNITFLFPWFLLGPLQITAADLSHSGRYSCVAKNAAGTAQRHIQLTVHGKRCTEIIKPNMLLKVPLNVFFSYFFLLFVANKIAYNRFPFLAPHLFSSLQFLSLCHFFI